VSGLLLLLLGLWGALIPLVGPCFHYAYIRHRVDGQLGTGLAGDPARRLVRARHAGQPAVGGAEREPVSQREPLAEREPLASTGPAGGGTTQPVRGSNQA